MHILFVNIFLWRVVFNHNPESQKYLHFFVHIKKKKTQDHHHMFKLIRAASTGKKNPQTLKMVVLCPCNTLFVESWSVYQSQFSNRRIHGCRLKVSRGKAVSNAFSFRLSQLLLFERRLQRWNDALKALLVISGELMEGRHRWVQGRCSRWWLLWRTEGARAMIIGQRASGAAI